MVVHRHRHGPLGPLLADHVLIEEFLELAGRRDGPRQVPRRPGFAFFLLDDVVAEVYAGSADVNVPRSFDHGARFPLRLAAKAAGGGASTTSATAT